MAALKEIQQLGWRCLRRWPWLSGAPWARQTLRYGVALLLTGAALLLRFHLDGAFHDSDAYVLFLVAAVGTNWLCGLGPCLLTLFLGLLAGNWFFAPPRGSLLIRGANAWYDLTTYAIAGLAIAWYGWGRRRAEDKLQTEMRTRKLAEQALLQVHGQLEQRVLERTVELEQSIKAMREFTYSIAHNLFAPLRAAHGFAELLLARCGHRLEQQGREFSQHIIEASERMSNLLEALLVFGRVASSEASLGKVNTGEVLEEAVRRVRRTPEGAKATIEWQSPLPPVQANAELLSEAVYRLLHNAVKYVDPETKARVQIRAEPEAATVRLRVEDNGIGIDRHYHAEIFGAFNRLVPDGSSNTGMGLTIAQKAVERMHGEIGLESEPGRGSRFWVKLPRAE